MTKRRVVIEISDAVVSDDPSDVLVTYSLGSCIGVCLYDSAIHTGGMLHYQLPTATMDPARARDKPFMFADTGMALLLNLHRPFEQVVLVGKGPPVCICQVGIECYGSAAVAADRA